MTFGTLKINICDFVLCYTSYLPTNFEVHHISNDPVGHDDIKLTDLHVNRKPVELVRSIKETNCRTNQRTREICIAFLFAKIAL